MLNRLLSLARSDGYQAIGVRCISELRAADPDLYSAWARRHREFESVASWVAGNALVPRNCLPHLGKRLYRFPGQNRSFSLALERAKNIRLFDSPVITFKGVEPLGRDFANLLRWLSIPRTNPGIADQFSPFDHFVFAENKVPGVLTVSEAMEETHRAWAFHREHVRRYKSFPEVPLPLSVLKIPEATVESTLKLFRELIPGKVSDRLENLSTGGFAVLVSYFPRAPLRASWRDQIPAQTVRSRLGRIPTADDSFDGWIRLVGRMFRLGFLPASVWSAPTGTCLDSQNAGIFGGVCDPDSIVRVSECRSDGFLFSSLVLCVDRLAQSLLAVRNFQGPSSSVEREMSKITVLNALAGEIDRKDARAIDPRIRKFFALRTAGDLDRVSSDWENAATSRLKLGELLVRNEQAYSNQ